MNQCDGCKRGLKLVDDIHWNIEGWAYMYCTAGRYSRVTPLRRDPDTGIIEDVPGADPHMSGHGSDPH